MTLLDVVLLVMGQSLFAGGIVGARYGACIEGALYGLFLGPVGVLAAFTCGPKIQNPPEFPLR